MIESTDPWWIKPGKKYGLTELIINLLVFIPLVIMIGAYKLLVTTYELRNAFKPTKRHYK